MVLIVGLGNPGKKYSNSRHNVGFMAVDSVLKKLGKVEESVWKEDKNFRCEIARVGREVLGGESTKSQIPNSKQILNTKFKTGDNASIVLIKPQTFMNASGVSVAKVLNFYKINPLGLFVIHDEIDLPLGKVKIVVNRGAAGHHGVESIIREIGTTNFIRIRIGIGREGEKREVGSGLGSEGLVGKMRGIWERRVRRGRATEDFVLEPFHKDEGGRLNDAIKRTVDIMEMILKEGVERAMGKYN